jgi:hypothetical protein
MSHQPSATSHQPRAGTGYDPRQRSAQVLFPCFPKHDCAAILIESQKGIPQTKTQRRQVGHFDFADSLCVLCAFA